MVDWERGVQVAPEAAPWKVVARRAAPPPASEAARWAAERVVAIEVVAAQKGVARGAACVAALWAAERAAAIEVAAQKGVARGAACVAAL